MERFYKKSTADFYTLVFLIFLSITTIVLDYKYNQITYIRSIINDLIVYPIDKLSNLPRSFMNELIRESSNIEDLERQLRVLEKKNISLKIQLQELNSLKDEGAGFETDTNKITILSKYNKMLRFELKSKHDVASDIVNSILNEIDA